MPRTTAAEVREVLTRDYTAGNSLDPFITVGNLMVTRLIARAAELVTPITVDTTTATALETWLAAHAYVMSDQNFASRATGRASATFQGQTGMYLEASKYGQMAITLDPTGLLKGMGKGAVAGGFWLGLNEREAPSYRERN